MPNDHISKTSKCNTIIYFPESTPPNPPKKRKTSAIYVPESGDEEYWDHRSQSYPAEYFPLSRFGYEICDDTDVDSDNSGPDGKGKPDEKDRATVPDGKKCDEEPVAVQKTWGLPPRGTTRGGKIWKVTKEHQEAELRYWARQSGGA